MIHSPLSRLSSRADEENGIRPSPLNPFATEIELESESESGDSLAPDPEEVQMPQVESEPFPPLPSDLAIVKTQASSPEPEKGHIEPPRTPSPVKIKTAQPTGPPSYEEVTDLPPGYLNTVVAVYPYKAADEDELSFAKGESIFVIKHPQPDEQV